MGDHLRFLFVFSHFSLSLRSPRCLTSRDYFMCWDSVRSPILWKRMSDLKLASEGSTTFAYWMGYILRSLFMTSPSTTMSSNHTPRMADTFSTTSFLLMPSNLRSEGSLATLFMNYLVTLKIPPMISPADSFQSPFQYRPFLGFSMLNSAKRPCSFYSTYPFPYPLNLRSPKIRPDISLGGKQHWKWLPLRRIICMMPSLPPTAELKLTSANATRLPYSVNSGQVIQQELMGGWWLICSQQIGIPFIYACRVSPRIGLKGFCMRSYRVGMVAMKATIFFIWQIRFSSAMGRRKSGHLPREAALRQIRDRLSKMSTGSETLSTDFPEKMLAPICLMTKMRESF